MITKGIVEELVTPYKIKVRIPVFDSIDGAKGATPNTQLSVATLCSLPNSKNILAKGDVVFVGFEDNDIGKPVILGHLYRDIDSASFLDLTTRLFTTTSSTRLSKDTTIGEISSLEIAALSGIRHNIQQQIDDLQEKIDNIT